MVIVGIAALLIHALSGSTSVHSSYQCQLLSPHPCTLWQHLCSLLLPVSASLSSSMHSLAALCSLLLPVSASLSSSLALSGSTFVHSSYQCRLLSPHPCTLWQLSVHSSYQCQLLSPHPCTLWQRLCSLLLPVSATLSSSWHSLAALLFTPPTSVGFSLLIRALSGSTSVHSSYQCRLLSPHPLHSLAEQLFRLTPPTSVGFSLLNPCTLWQCLCSLLLPVLAAFSSSLYSLAAPVHSSYQCCCSLLIPCILWQSSSFGSLLLPVLASLSSTPALSGSASVHSSYQCRLLSPHPLNSLKFLLCDLSLFSVSYSLCRYCLSSAALPVSVASCIVLLLSCATCGVSFCSYAFRIV